MRGLRPSVAGRIAIAATVGLLLAGCAASPDVRIAYELDGAEHTVEFAQPELTCDVLGARGTTFTDRPFRGVSVSDSGRVTAWVHRDLLVVFESDEAEVSSARQGDGSVEYRVRAEGGRVATLDVQRTDPSVEPDLSDARRTTGDLDLTVRCVPEEDEG